MQIEKGKYRHFKGNLYEVVDMAIHSETLEKMVVYRPLYGDQALWVRPASMWFDEVEAGGEKRRRFEPYEDQ